MSCLCELPRGHLGGALFLSVKGQERIEHVVFEVTWGLALVNHLPILHRPPRQVCGKPLSSMLVYTHSACSQCSGVHSSQCCFAGEGIFLWLCREHCCLLCCSWHGFSLLLASHLGPDRLSPTAQRGKKGFCWCLLAETLTSSLALGRK